MMMLINRGNTYKYVCYYKYVCTIIISTYTYKIHNFLYYM